MIPIIKTGNRLFRGLIFLLLAIFSVNTSLAEKKDAKPGIKPIVVSAKSKDKKHDPNYKNGKYVGPKSVKEIYKRMDGNRKSYKSFKDMQLEFKEETEKRHEERQKRLKEERKSKNSALAKLSKQINDYLKFGK